MSRPRKAPTLPEVTEQRVKEMARLVADLSYEFSRPASALALDIGVTERHLRNVVRDARRHGLPVISDNAGYRLGRGDDLTRCANRLEAHALREMARAADLRRIASRGILGPGIWDREGAR